MQQISGFNGKTGRYYDLKIKFVDISHHRYKLRRDIEQSPFTGKIAGILIVSDHSRLLTPAKVLTQHSS
jgi:hypothetical protein